MAEGVTVTVLLMTAEELELMPIDLPLDDLPVNDQPGGKVLGSAQVYLGEDGNVYADCDVQLEFADQLVSLSLPKQSK